MTEQLAEAEAPNFRSLHLPTWLPREAHTGVFTDGDKYLIAVKVANTQSRKVRWEFYTIVASVDEGDLRWFELNGLEDGEIFDTWSFEDCSYYIKY